jgi:hypothetical protein
MSRRLPDLLTLAAVLLAAAWLAAKALYAPRSLNFLLLLAALLAGASFWMSWRALSRKK